LKAWIYQAFLLYLYKIKHMSEYRMSVDPTLQTKKFTSTDGIIRYMKDGKLHNWEGPAVIHPDGKEEYFINGTQHTKDSHHKAKRDGIGLPWYKSGVAKQRF
jgi:hypothetical protein